MRHQNKKGKTIFIPHRVFNKTSIYLALFRKVEKKDFLGYEAVIPLGENGTITVQSMSNISPHDGLVFDFVLNQWQSAKKANQEITYIEVDIEAIIHALKLKNRTENRAKVIQHLKNMCKVSISFAFDKNEILFNMLESVMIIDGTSSVSVVVSSTYEKATIIAKPRYINIDKVMSLKNSHAIELQRLLQMDGQGVSKKWEPRFAKTIEHQRVCNYLHLSDNKSSLDAIRRAFKALESIGLPRYKYSSKRALWSQVTTTESVVLNTESVVLNT